MAERIDGTPLSIFRPNRPSRPRRLPGLVLWGTASPGLGPFLSNGGGFVGVYNQGLSDPNRPEHPIPHGHRNPRPPPPWLPCLAGPHLARRPARAGSSPCPRGHVRSRVRQLERRPEA